MAAMPRLTEIGEQLQDWNISASFGWRGGIPRGGCRGCPRAPCHGLEWRLVGGPLRRRSALGCACVRSMAGSLPKHAGWTRSTSRADGSCPGAPILRREAWGGFEGRRASHLGARCPPEHRCCSVPACQAVRLPATARPAMEAPQSLASPDRASFAACGAEPRAARRIGRCNAAAFHRQAHSLPHVPPAALARRWSVGR